MLLYLGQIINNQKQHFKVFTTEARKLILANLLFGIFNPFYLIFSNTFIFQNTHGDLAFNLLYSCFNFTGIVTGFVLNGFLLRYFHVKRMLIVGSVFLFLSIVILFCMPTGILKGAWVLVFGIVAGTSNGIYWSSRNYLTVVSTTNQNRDFFSGIDFLLISAGRVITPLFVGLFIGETVRLGWLTPEWAYRATLIAALGLIISMASGLKGVRYASVHIPQFLFLKYNKLWIQNRKLMFIIGLFHGAFMAVPPLIIMMFVGNEAIVGTLSSVSYIFAIIVVYYISRKSTIEMRTKIMTIGIIIFIAGAVLFALLIHIYPTLATILLILGIFFSEPIMNYPQRATYFNAVDKVKEIEGRDNYAYIVDMEMFCNLARVISIVAFYLLYCYFEVKYAITIYMLSISILQLWVIRYSRIINSR